jgi:Cu/Ag efflux pump CusA
VIRREGVSPYMDVTFNAQGRAANEVARDVEAAVRRINFPLEYHAEVLHQYAERQAAQQRLLIAGIIALVGIFLLMQASFQSWRLGAVAFITLPLAMTGGIAVTLATQGGVISLGSLAGLFAIFGIAVRHGLALVNHYQYLQEEEGEEFGPALALRGASDRLVPILMSTFAIGLFFLSFVFFDGAPGHEIGDPMSMVIIGGLVASLLINIFVMPVLYLRFGYNPELAASRARFGAMPEPGLSSD